MSPAPRGKGRPRKQGTISWLTAGLLAVYIQGTRVHVTVTEFKLLSTLIRNAGRVMTHRELLEQVWGPHFAGDVHFPRIYINHLRTKLEPDSTHPIYISTERSIGYRFEKRHIS